MKNANLPTRLLVCPVRTKIYVVKLTKNGKPDSRQRAVNGSTIAFPQNNPISATSLPFPPSSLKDSFHAVFLGRADPTTEQLEKMFRVKKVEVLELLNDFKKNGHPSFQAGSWDPSALSEIEENELLDVLDSLANCVDIIEPEVEEKIEVEQTSYIGRYLSFSFVLTLSLPLSMFVVPDVDPEDEDEGTIFFIHVCL